MRLDPEKDKLYPNDINELLIARYDKLVKVYLDFQRIKNRFGNKQLRQQRRHLSQDKPFGKHN